MHHSIAVQCLDMLQVLAQHHPGLKLHSDIRDLNLASEVGEGVLLDVVVISTPCVDVSPRGLGQAQLGEVCTFES